MKENETHVDRYSDADRDILKERLAQGKLNWRSITLTANKLTLTLTTDLV